jgi:hypothetical protein
VSFGLHSPPFASLKAVIGSLLKTARSRSRLATPPVDVENDDPRPAHARAPRKSDLCDSHCESLYTFLRILY